MLHAVYGRIFKEVLYIVWDKTIGAKSMRREGNMIFCTIRERRRYQSKCLSELITSTPSIQSADGLLTCHMDFLIKPSALLLDMGGHSSLDQIWQLGHGLTYKEKEIQAPLCFSDKASFDADDSWFWWSGKDGAWDSALNARQQVFGQDSTNKNTICGGWSDLFYLPKATFNTFLQLTPHFADVMHEIALPTIINMLQQEAGFATRTPIECAGNCCALMSRGQRDTGTETIETAACGHKIDLINETVRNAWSSTMQDEVNQCGV
jgi:hypothetical protein